MILMSLRQALTHASLERSSWNVYERLEFLGDRVLGLVVSETLLKSFQTKEKVRFLGVMLI